MRRFLTMFLKLSVSVVLIVVFFAKLDIDAGRLFTAWRSADVGLLAFAVAVFFTSNLLGASQWQTLLHAQGLRLRYRHVVATYLTGVFLNSFLIGNIGGDVVRVNDIRKEAGNGTAGFAATFLDRFLGFLALLGLSALAYPLAKSGVDTEVRAPMLALAGAMGVVLVLGFSRRVSRSFQSFVARRLPGRASEVLGRAIAGLLLFRGKKRAVLTACMLSIIVQLLRICAFFLVGLSFGMTTPFHCYLLFLPLIATVTAIPISFGGLGIRENITALLFATVGVPSATAWSLGFFGYLVGIVSCLPGAIVFSLRSMRRSS